MKKVISQDNNFHMINHIASLDVVVSAGGNF